MSNYDFTTSLSPIDFELLSKDLLEAELGITLENFSEGRDKGIDLRYAPIRSTANDIFKLALSGLADLAHGLENRHISPSFCIEAVEPLKDFGYLSSEQGRQFVTALKAGVTKNPCEYDEFETLALVVSALPESFTDPELKAIRNAYAGFAHGYAKDCANGEFDIDDPEEIRAEASRLEYVGDLLGVDTKVEQNTILNYAEKREQESQDNRDWDPDDERRGGYQSDGCSDRDLDSMFSTLGN